MSCTLDTHSFVHAHEGAYCECGKMVLRATDEDGYIARRAARPSGRLHVDRIMDSDWPSFQAKFDSFCLSHKVVRESIKFQRNLYYSLSGSTHVEGKMALEDGKELKEDHIAFILWED